MNKIIKIILFFFFILLFFLIFSSLNLEEEIPALPVNIGTEKIGYSLIEENRSGSDTIYQFDISFPLLEGNNVESINNDIELFVDEMINEFKLGLVGPNFQEGNFLEINYSIARFDESVLSIEFLILNDYVGSPRPITLIRSLNYNLKEKSRFNIDDCFNDLIPISEHVKGDLLNQFGDIFWEEGAEPLRRNFDNFIVLDDSFEILFSPYQVTPFSEGITRSSILFSDFKNIITCDFVY